MSRRKTPVCRKARPLKLRLLFSGKHLPRLELTPLILPRNAGEGDHAKHVEGARGPHRAPRSQSAIIPAMVRTLELAMSKAAELPEAAQEQLGREMLERIDALAELRNAIELGVRQLDAGEGKELDIAEIIRQARREHANR